MIQPDGQMTTALLLAVFIFLLLLAGLLVLLAVILLFRRRRSEKESDVAWERMQTVVHVPGADEDHTVDKWEPVPGAFGFLTVLYSDDRSKIGRGEIGFPRFAVLALLCVPLLYMGWRAFYFLTDDAFIPFRYVSNSIFG